MLEGNFENSWQWCSDRVELLVRNLSNKERNVTLGMTVTAGYDEMSNLYIERSSFKEKFRSMPRDIFLKAISLSPGIHVIQSEFDTSQDPRTIFFQVTNFKIKLDGNGTHRELTPPQDLFGNDRRNV